MSREDIYKIDPIIEQMRNRLKEKESFDQCDSGRIGGYSGNIFSNLDELSDEQIVQKYFHEKNSEEYAKYLP